MLLLSSPWPVATTPASKPSSMKPIWAMVEKASMRFRLVWAMAARLPISSEATDSTASICCQSTAKGARPSTSRRITMANAASLGAPPIIRVTAVGAPWYTSGTHMWNGTTPSLKARPATTNTNPSVSTCGDPLSVASPPAMAFITSATSSDAVAPYTSDSP